MKAQGRTLAQLVLGLLVFTVVISPSQSIHPVQAASYLPGVTVGNWASFGLLYGRCTSTVTPNPCADTSSLPSSVAIVATVTEMSGPIVILKGELTGAGGIGTSGEAIVDVS